MSHHKSFNAVFFFSRLGPIEVFIRMLVLVYLHSGVPWGPSPKGQLFGGVSLPKPQTTIEIMCISGQRVISVQIQIYMASNLNCFLGNVIEIIEKGVMYIHNLVLA